MRIVSWNMNLCKRSPEARARAWDYLRDGLHADVGWCRKQLHRHTPKPLIAPSARATSTTTGVLLSWRSDLASVCTRAPLSSWDFGERPADALPDSHPGASAVADVFDANGQSRFTAVSLYGQWEMTGGDKNYHACARVHRILSDVTDVLARSKSRPVVLASDFNLTTQLEYQGQKPATADATAVGRQRRLVSAAR